MGHGGAVFPSSWTSSGWIDRVTSVAYLSMRMVLSSRTMT